MTVPPQRGLVVGAHGHLNAVEGDDGTIYRCTRRSKLGALVCGDRVQWQPDGHGGGVVVTVEPRRTLLQRPDTRGRLKPIAANVDQLVVVVAVPNAELAVRGQDAVDTYMVDRFLVAAHASGIAALVLVNKADLLDASHRAAAEAVISAYQSHGQNALLTSIVNDEGLTPLATQLARRTSVFVGPSGAGKSSLVDHFLPDWTLRVGAVAETTGLGRHTTTAGALYHLPQGGELIDSPGVREFGLWNLEPERVAAAFGDLHSRAAECRFNNCRHLSEPDCAVRAALEAGTLSATRYENYRRIIESLGSVR